MVLMVGFLALAIDLGMLAIAKTQAQQAADVAALTAAAHPERQRSINYNQSAATTNAQNVLTYNPILGQPLQSSQLQLTYGSYDYNQTTQTFNANYPATSGMPETAVTATVTIQQLAGRVQLDLGVAIPPERHSHRPGGPPAARHRPGDGPLRLDALRHLPRVRLLHHLAHHQQSRHPVPTFGHYSSSNAGMQGPTTNQTSSLR